MYDEQYQLTGQDPKGIASENPHIKTSIDEQALKNLTKESIVSLEQQCNKMCQHKMMQAFIHVHNTFQPSNNNQI